MQTEKLAIKLKVTSQQHKIQIKQNSADHLNVHKIAQKLKG